MSDVGFILFSIVFILVLVVMIMFRNKVIVFDWNRGLKIYFEDFVYEEDEIDEV